MKEVNALSLRQSLGRVLHLLERGGSPILVRRGKNPAAVLISLEDWRKRFVDRDADEARRAIVARIKSSSSRLPPGKSSLVLLRELRGETP